MFEFGPIQILGMAVDGTWREGSPLSAGWVPLERGVNALYGLNGAGKSLILEALVAALTGEHVARSDGIRLEVVLKLSDDAFKGDEPDAEWNDFVYVRREISEFFASFERPGEYMVQTIDHVNADGHVWVYIDDVLDRVQQAIERSIEMTTFLPADVTAAEVAAELVRQRMFAISSDGSGLVVRGMPDEASPTLARVVQWRESATEDEGNDNSSSIELIWPSASEERRRVLPPIYEWCYQDWSVRRLGIPVLGLPGFDANKSTAVAFNEIARRLATGPKPGAAKRLDSMSLVLPSLEASSVEMNYRRIADAYCDRAWVVLDDHGNVSDDSVIVAVASSLVADANRYYAQLLMDAPTLEIDLGSPKSWFAGDGLLWGARRSLSSPWVPLEHLSQAERRWANVAIELALAIVPAGFLVLDEPEQALHRSAEAYMARGLQSLGQAHDLCIVVATHSTEVINLTKASIHAVRRVDQGLVDHRQVHPLRDVDRDDLREFGMLPSDLLRRQRGLLLVEGEHDVVVWQALLGEQLNQLRVEMVPIRGAGELKATLDSRVLYDFTDAHLFVMLDALDSEVVTAVWNEACRLAKTQSPQAAAEFAARELKKLKVDEAGSLAAWASRALALGREARHTPLTLSAADILDYLPVTAFVSDATSWDALREECAKSRGGRMPSGTQFKEWLRKAKRADLSVDAIRAAAISMDSIPAEFTNHLNRMHQILNR